MNVEDSYEGAVRRLNRLRHAGLPLTPLPAHPPEDDERDRLHDLEELATLACDENEQLKHELAVAHGELARLRQLVAMHQEALAGARDDEPLRVPRRRGGVLAFFAVILVGGGVAA